MANEIVAFGEGRIWKWRLCGNVVVLCSVQECRWFGEGRIWKWRLCRNVVLCSLQEWRWFREEGRREKL